jgi:hypothetical protein
LKAIALHQPSPSEFLELKRNTCLSGNKSVNLSRKTKSFKTKDIKKWISQEFVFLKMSSKLLLLSLIRQSFWFLNWIKWRSLINRSRQGLLLAPKSCLFIYTLRNEVSITYWLLISRTSWSWRKKWKEKENSKRKENSYWCLEKY